MEHFIDIVLDGPPGAEMPRFVCVEGSDGRSINFGSWITRADGATALRIHDGDFAKALNEQTPDPTVFPNDE